MRLIDANPGCTISHHEDEYFVYGTFNWEGEAFEIRIPIGDGMYHAELAVTRILLKRRKQPPDDEDALIG